MTQVDWHPSPDEMPTGKSRYLLVTLHLDNEKDIVLFTGWNLYGVKGFSMPDKFIKAWSELPDPYRAR